MQLGIFVERSHLLWKAPDALELLRVAATRAADIAEGRKPPTTAASAAQQPQLGAEDWACVQHESFPESEVNEYRHLRLHDFTDNVNALPR